ncbi:hypothetical protein B7Z00_03415 [Candidatus Saccharibacteria bacterium 32-50-10]|nr:MAG: hypothetical protein B7Z00_03415 [Candidatus Saccharibacteria bacterium 32-50-10]
MARTNTLPQAAKPRHDDLDKFGRRDGSVSQRNAVYHGKKDPYWAPFAARVRMNDWSAAGGGDRTRRRPGHLCMHRTLHLPPRDHAPDRADPRGLRGCDQLLRRAAQEAEGPPVQDARGLRPARVEPRLPPAAYRLTHWPN